MKFEPCLFLHWRSKKKMQHTIANSLLVAKRICGKGCTNGCQTSFFTRIKASTESCLKTQVMVSHMLASQSEDHWHTLNHSHSNERTFTLGRRIFLGQIWQPTLQTCRWHNRAPLIVSYWTCKWIDNEICAPILLLRHSNYILTAWYTYILSSAHRLRETD